MNDNIIWLDDYRRWSTARRGRPINLWAAGGIAAMLLSAMIMLSAFYGAWRLFL